MTLSNRDKEIICKELELTGVKSVVLIGSRARCNGNRNSDYDLYVVISTMMLPLIYLKLERKARVLKEMLGSNVSLAPMTIMRIKYGKDLLLLKTKNEGITLCGYNYLVKIGIKTILDVPSDEIYSYLFSAYYFLIEYFDSEGIIGEKCVLNTAKCNIYCAEVQLMMRGYSCTNRDDLIKEIKARGFTDHLDLILISKKIIENGPPFNINPFDFWLRAREYLIYIFILMNKEFTSFGQLSLEMQIENIKSMSFSSIKNLQFFVFLLIRRELLLSKIFRRINIEKYFWYVLLCLVMAIESDFTINNRYLVNSYKVIEDIGLGHNIKNLTWNSMRNVVTEYWQIASAKSAV